MTAKHYVYVLDTNDGLISAALSCPDAKTAQRAYQMAKREFESEHGKRISYHFGFDSVDSQVTIEYEIPPKGGYQKGWVTTQTFNRDDFESAVERTEKALSKGWVQDDILFIQYAQAARTELFLGFDLRDVPPEKSETLIPPWKKVLPEPAIEEKSLAMPQPIQSTHTSVVADATDSVSPAIPPVVDECLSVPTLPIIAPRIKKRKESANKTTFKADLENMPMVNAPDDVNVKNLQGIEDAVFSGTYRAFARFGTPKDETPIEKIHRLRCDGVDWKYIGRTIYKEEHEKDIDEKDLPTYVDSLRKQHRREYPDFYHAEK